MTIDDVTLWHGDCLELMGQIPDGSVDAIITDPPYNAINRGSNGLRVFDKGEADSAPIDIDRMVAEFARVCIGSVYVWCSTEQAGDWRRHLDDAGFSTRQCVWVKTNPPPTNGQHLWLSGVELCVFGRKPKATFNRHCAVPAWQGPSERVPGFPTPKPVWLMQIAIEASTSPGDVVMDTTMGSGTTGVACLRTGRRFIGIEKDAGYYEIARKRIDDELAKTALLTGA